MPGGNNSPTMPGRKPPQVEEFQFGPWKIKTVKSHILSSEEESSISTQLSLPHLPDMMFANNLVSLSNSEAGKEMIFNPLDALARVNNSEDLVKVSNAASWQAARQDSPHLAKVVHPYDWTFTTDYKGTLVGDWSVELTETKIDYEKLKVQEKILFFDEVVLYEDELDDNGVTKLSVKMRVMPSGIFLLLRFYLRVDNTLIRVYDTRVYFEVENDFILREYSEREETVEKLVVPREVWTDQNEIINHLPVTKTVIEKLKF